MAVDPDPQPTMSWKGKLLEGHAIVSDLDRFVPSAGSDNDFEFLEGDVNMTIIDGVHAITFSDRIKDILFREMELTVIVKLLGRNIGYNALHNRILFLWKLGHWIVYGQYLTTQPWTKHFSPSRPYPSVKVVKLDVQTDNQTRGRFARLVVYLNLEKPLISQIIVDDAVQRVEYEALPTVCFACRKYRHVKETCPSVVTEKTLQFFQTQQREGTGVWAVDVGRKKSSWRGKQDPLAEVLVKQTKNLLGSKFSALMEEKESSVDSGLSAKGILGEKSNVVVAANLRNFKPRVNKKGDGVYLVDAD
ncbi:hypothetical protein Godav_011607, partial [Gossypium davidsonii]|nr:hypothetical protein [Gossypium davidsonii]